MVWCLQRYEKFLRVKAVMRDAVVPNALVEAVWQAHILRTRAYVTDCVALCGRIIEHDFPDPKAPHTAALKAQTAKEWAQLFPEDVLSAAAPPSAAAAHSNSHLARFTPGAGGAAPASAAAAQKAVQIVGFDALGTELEAKRYQKPLKPVVVVGGSSSTGSGSGSGSSGAQQSVASIDLYAAVLQDFSWLCPVVSTATATASAAAPSATTTTTTSSAPSTSPSPSPSTPAPSASASASVLSTAARPAVQLHPSFTDPLRVRLQFRVYQKLLHLLSRHRATPVAAHALLAVLDREVVARVHRLNVAPFGSDMHRVGVAGVVLMDKPTPTPTPAPASASASASEAAAAAVLGAAYARAPAVSSADRSVLRAQWHTVQRLWQLEFAEPAEWGSALLLPLLSPASPTAAAGGGEQKATTYLSHRPSPLFPLPPSVGPSPPDSPAISPAPSPGLSPAPAPDTPPLSALVCVRRAPPFDEAPACLPACFGVGVQCVIWVGLGWVVLAFVELRVSRSVQLHARRLSAHLILCFAGHHHHHHHHHHLCGRRLRLNRRHTASVASAGHCLATHHL